MPFPSTVGNSTPLPWRTVGRTRTSTPPCPSDPVGGRPTPGYPPRPSLHSVPALPIPCCKRCGNWIPSPQRKVAPTTPGGDVGLCSTLIGWTGPPGIGTDEAVRPRSFRIRRGSSAPYKRFLCRDRSIFGKTHRLSFFDRLTSLLLFQQTVIDEEGSETMESRCLHRTRLEVARAERAHRRRIVASCSHTCRKRTAMATTASRVQVNAFAGKQLRNARNAQARGVRRSLRVRAEGGEEQAKPAKVRDAERRLREAQNVDVRSGTAC